MMKRLVVDLLKCSKDTSPKALRIRMMAAVEVKVVVAHQAVVLEEEMVNLS